MPEKILSEIQSNVQQNGQNIVLSLSEGKSDHVIFKKNDWILGIPVVVFAILLVMYLAGIFTNSEKSPVVLNAFALSVMFTLVLAVFFTQVKKLGRFGEFIERNFSRIPLLDVAVSLFSWIPWTIALIVGGTAALVGTVGGQMIALIVWSWIHDLANPEAARGPRILKFLNKRFGWWRNNMALWLTLIALPLFLSIRLLQIFLYPWMTWLIGWPKYDQSQWISVSRYKFRNLVGQDLVWCLYCDWMTGVYALTTRILRVTESYWCPVRFYDAVKNKYCRQDFPDIDKWVSNEGTMEDVEKLLDNMYPDKRKSANFDSSKNKV